MTFRGVQRKKDCAVRYADFFGQHSKDYPNETLTDCYAQAVCRGRGHRVLSGDDLRD